MCASDKDYCNECLRDHLDKCMASEDSEEESDDESE